MNDELLCYRDNLNNSEELLRARFQQILTNFKEDIDNRYETIISSIHTATKKCIRKRRFKRFLKTYWNTALSKYRADVRRCRDKWISEGRPPKPNSITRHSVDARRRYLINVLVLVHCENVYKQICSSHWLLKYTGEIFNLQIEEYSITPKNILSYNVIVNNTINYLCIIKQAILTYKLWLPMVIPDVWVVAKQ